MNWRELWPWCVAVALVSPLSWRVCNTESFSDVRKPVDFFVSDALLLTIPVLVWACLRKTSRQSASIGNRYNALHLLVLALLTYCAALAFVGWQHSNELTRFLSAGKLVKPLVYVWIGGWIARFTDVNRMIERIGWAFVGTAVVWIASTIADPAFPATAWGSHWLGQQVLGFPNTAMTFVAALLPVLLAVAELNERQRLCRLAAAAFVGMSVLVVCSLSRCAVMVMLSGLTVYLMFTGVRWKVVALSGVAILYVATAYSLFVLDSEAVAVNEPRLQERAAHRFTRPVSPASGALSGRSAIWKETCSLIAAHPVSGYHFEHFSRYSRFDTPHQQYLEVIFKMGTVGFAMYCTVLVVGVNDLLRSWKNRPIRSESALHGRDQVREDKAIIEHRLLAALCGMVAGILIGNFSQANLTYSLTGNCLFFAIGLVHEHCRATKCVQRSWTEGSQLPEQGGLATQAKAA